jgi:hypothetical protein
MVSLTLSFKPSSLTSCGYHSIATSKSHGSRLQLNTFVCNDCRANRARSRLRLRVDISGMRSDLVDKGKSVGLEQTVSTRRKQRNHQRQQLTSTMFSSCLSTAAIGAPMIGTVLNSLALEARVLASFDCAVANCFLRQRRSAWQVNFGSVPLHRLWKSHQLPRQQQLVP